MDLGLDKKVALIAGSTKGLGFATSKILLEEGAKIMVNSRSQKNVDSSINTLTKNNSNGNVLGFACDVTDEKSCAGLVAETISKFGGLDILVTNSGGPPAGTFSELSIDQWKDAIDLSFMSHTYLIKNALKYLKKSATPSVLAITSFTIKSPLDNLILSNTIRAATAALIKSLSIELGREGIRFNSILPGWTKTERVDSLLISRAAKSNSTVDAELGKITRSIPLKRMAEPEEFARVAAFLVSPAASYVNGVMLNVDGGITKSLF